MTDRNFRDRGSRGRDGNWEEDRFEDSGYGRSPHRFENEERWGMNAGYGSSFERGSGTGQHSGKGPKGWKRSDERITEEVNEALSRHPELDASEIEVTVKDREVKLTGIVEDRGQKRLAEDVVDDVFGVEDVDNDLKIRHGFLAGLTGEKADEREIQRSASREPTLGTTGRGTPSKGRGRSELDTR